MEKVNSICCFILAHSRSFLELTINNIINISSGLSAVEKPEARKGGEEDCDFKLSGEKRV